MKKTAQILLFIFIAFLATPSVVCAIKKGADISSFYNLTEEEQVHKDIKIVYDLYPIFYWVAVPLQSSQPILSENLLNFNEISLGVFIPPPELI
jgi:hypothetical protein